MVFEQQLIRQSQQPADHKTDDHITQSIDQLDASVCQNEIFMKRCVALIRENCCEADELSQATLNLDSLIEGNQVQNEILRNIKVGALDIQLNELEEYCTTLCNQLKTFRIHR